MSFCAAPSACELSLTAACRSDLGLSPTTFAPLLRRLVLTPDQFTVDDVRAAMLHLTSPDGATAAQMSAFLTALKLSRKDSEPDVVAECARVMRSRAVPFVVPPSEQGVDVCDIVGTGGDGHNTFNVSTSAALVAAGAGCRVHKVSYLCSSLLSTLLTLFIASAWQPRRNLVVGLSRHPHLTRVSGARDDTPETGRQG